MQRLFVVVLGTLFAFSMQAQAVHRATPVHELLQRATWLKEAPPPPPAATLLANAAVTKTFNITARSFTFDIAPAPFVVNLGDTVTLNISVPANDPAAGGHGFLLEQFLESGIPIGRGRTQTLTFVANSVGTFTFLCTVSTCGSGHSQMNGVFTVNAPVPLTVSGISPSSGPSTGGTTVTIQGSGFTPGQPPAVTFGGTAAASVTVTDASTITAVTPAHAAGVVEVVVSSGTSSAKTAFTFNASTAPARRRAAGH